MNLDPDQWDDAVSIPGPHWGPNCQATICTEILQFASLPRYFMNSKIPSRLFNDNEVPGQFGKPKLLSGFEDTWLFRFLFNGIPWDSSSWIWSSGLSSPSTKSARICLCPAMAWSMDQKTPQAEGFPFQGSSSISNIDHQMVDNGWSWFWNDCAWSLYIILMDEFWINVGWLLYECCRIWQTPRSTSVTRTRHFSKAQAQSNQHRSIHSRPRDHLGICQNTGKSNWEPLSLFETQVDSHKSTEINLRF